MLIESKGDRIFNVINYVVLILVTLVVLYPLVFVLSASFSDPQTVLRGEMLLWPKGINLNSYEKIFRTRTSSAALPTRLFTRRWERRSISS